MVSIRFKYLIILCGLIAGSSIHALTPGMRAKIGDLTRDIKNKTINPTEARKRALALKISPSDMNDKSISNLILTADSVGIQDILNPTIASKTDVKAIKTEITQNEPVIAKEEPIVEQKITEIITSNKETQEELQNKETIVITPKENPAFEEIQKDLQALLKNTITFMEDIDKRREKNPRTIDQTENEFSNKRNQLYLQKESIEKKTANLMNNKQLPKPLKSMQDLTLKTMDEADKKFQEFQNLKTRNLITDRVIKNLTDKNAELTDLLKASGANYPETIAQRDRDAKQFQLDEFNNPSLNIRSYPMYAKDIRTVDKLAEEIDTNIQKLLEMNKKASEKKEIKETFIETPTETDISALVNQLNASVNDLDSILKELTQLSKNQNISDTAIQNIQQKYEPAKNRMEKLIHQGNEQRDKRKTTEPIFKGGELMRKIDRQMEELQKQKNTLAPMSTADTKRNVTTSGIKPYILIANRTYTKDTLEKYNNSLQRYLNNYKSIMLDDDYKNYNDTAKESVVIGSLNNLLDIIKDNSVSFNEKLYKHVLPTYYLTKQRLAIHPFEKGQDKLEEILNTEMPNPHGIFFKVDSYINSFENGY